MSTEEKKTSLICGSNSYFNRPWARLVKPTSPSELHQRERERETERGAFHRTVNLNKKSGQTLVFIIDGMFFWRAQFFCVFIVSLYE